MFETEIKAVSDQYKIDSNLVKAIISQESQWQIFVTRYEPNYRWLYKPDEYAKNAWISLQTELQTQKMSWGLGQIMGAVAREQGHIGFMGELLNPIINLKHIAIRISTIEHIASIPEEIFAVYNGGPDALHKINGQFRNNAYVESAMTYLTKYQQSAKIE